VVVAASGRTKEPERDLVCVSGKHKARVNHHHTAGNSAQHTRMLGQPSAAFVLWMQKAAAEGSPCYAFFAGDTSFARVKDKPGVVRFMRSLESQWEARRKSPE
jgi:hypothetical protein